MRMSLLAITLEIEPHNYEQSELHEHLFTHLKYGAGRILVGCKSKSLSFLP